MALQHELVVSLSWGLAADNGRFRLSRALATISFEHGSSVLELIASGKYTSATSLLRPQYEALVRSFWFHYCASDGMVERLSDESRLTANEKLPTVNDMLGKLEECAPDSMVTSLIEFRDSSWRPLSSYIHGGMHAIRWTETGFPGRILEQLIRICDGMLVFSALHLAELSGSRDNGLLVVACAERHSASLPVKRRGRDAV